MNINPITDREAKQYSPLALAFLGDSVYEILVREFLLRNANMPASQLHEKKIKLVCASYQSSAVDRIFHLLSEDEISVYKRGRNATGNSVPKHSSASDYRKATGLEALFGYLFLIGEEERLNLLFNKICQDNPTNCK